ncbi:MAG: glycosyltransferase [Clostridia bacterium]|nr:glycosyltransferase [Clostridia bacterium]
MVSVVMTTCKRNEKTVERAVKSVVSQTYGDWELIVVDDSPADYPYRDEVKKCVLSLVTSDKITYISNAVNSGACYSRNVGLAVAKGEYIAYLDDDDEWLPQKLEEQVKELKHADRETAMVYGPFYRVDEETGKKELVMAGNYSGYVYEELMTKCNFIGGLSMPMMRTACVKEAGGFDEQLQAAQDLDLWLRIAQKYKIKYMPSPLLLYYIHGDQITNNPRKKIQGLERLNQKNKAYLDANPSAWYGRHMAILPYYVRNGEMKKAIAVWWQCVKKQPLNIAENTGMLLTLIRLKRSMNNG